MDCFWSKTPEDDGSKTVRLSVYETGGEFYIEIDGVEGSFEHGKITSVPFIILTVLVIVEAVVFFVVNKIRG